MPGPRAPRGGWQVVVIVVLVAGATALVLVEPHGTAAEGLVPIGVESYLLPRSAFNITDHNLTYATNGFLLRTIETGSFAATLSNQLVASGAHPPGGSEAEVGLGPVPAGPDETNITPLLIVQEAASGLLRIEYIPFPMNDTYGFLVYDATVAPAGPAPFAGHVLTIQYSATAPPVAPYAVSHPYGATTGNLTVRWDGSVIVPRYPIAWANFGAFYAYGLETGGFSAGAIFANVTTLAPSGTTATSGGTAGPTPLLVGARPAG